MQTFLSARGIKSACFHQISSKSQYSHFTAEKEITCFQQAWASVRHNVLVVTSLYCIYTEMYFMLLTLH